MDKITLRELCEMSGVSRRAVQGYEKAGLVKPTARNNRGHLLYDEKSLKRIERIRLYQQLGFKIKEIKHLIDAPDIEVKEALKEQVKKVEIQKDDVIRKTYDLINVI